MKKQKPLIICTAILSLLVTDGLLVSESQNELDRTE